MYRKLLILLISTLTSFNLFSAVTVTGKVLEESDSSPMVGAMIRDEGSNKVTVTDLDGIFKLTVEKYGTPITVSYVGYTPVTAASESSPMTFVMTREDKKGTNAKVEEADIYKAEETKDTNKEPLKQANDAFINYSDELLKKAEKGDPESQYNLGQAYCLGKGIESDMKKGYYWVSKAADQGYEQAMSMKGSMCYYGLGTKRDFKEAVKWMNKVENPNFNKTLYFFFR